MSADQIRSIIRAEAARIVSLRMNPFTTRAEVRRTATRINVPYGWLLAHVMLREYEPAPIPAAPIPTEAQDGDI